MGLAWDTKHDGGQPELYSRTLSEKNGKNGRREGREEGKEDKLEKGRNGYFNHRTSVGTWGGGVFRK